MAKASESNSGISRTAPDELEPLFDRDGFFIDPARWDVALAQHLAHGEGLGELDAAQIELLLTLRDEYSKFGTVTALSHICHLHDQEADCLHELFRTPRQAWRLAGLPNPGEEAKAYLA